MHEGCSKKLPVVAEARHQPGRLCVTTYDSSHRDCRQKKVRYLYTPYMVDEINHVFVFLPASA